MLYLPNIEESRHFDRLLRLAGQTAEQLADDKRLFSQSSKESFKEILATGKLTHLNGLLMFWPKSDLDSALELIMSLDTESHRARFVTTLIKHRYKENPSAAISLVNTNFPGNEALYRTAVGLYANSAAPEALSRIQEYRTNTGDNSLLAAYIQSESAYDLDAAMNLISNLDGAAREESLIAIAHNRFRQDRDNTIAWALTQENANLRNSYLQKYVDFYPEEAKITVAQLDDPEEKRLLVRQIVATLINFDESGAVSYARQNGEQDYVEKLLEK